MFCCQVSCVLCRLCIFPRIKRNFAALMPEINSVMYLVVPWVRLPSASRRTVLRVSAHWTLPHLLGFAMFYQCYRFSCCCKSRIGETVQLWGYEHLWYLWHLWVLLSFPKVDHIQHRGCWIVTEWPCVASWFFAWLGCSHESGLRRRWSGDDALDSVLRLAALAAIFLCVYLAVMVQTKQSMFQHAKSMCDLFVSFCFCCLIRLLWASFGSSMALRFACCPSCTGPIATQKLSPFALRSSNKSWIMSHRWQKEASASKVNMEDSWLCAIDVADVFIYVYIYRERERTTKWWTSYSENQEMGSE